jgi:hypothetical protein
MTPRQAELAKASTARVAARAAELMVEFPDMSVNECLAFSLFEEEFIYGCSAIEHPVGLLGWSPLEGGKP